MTTYEIVIVIFGAITLTLSLVTMIVCLIKAINTKK